MPVGWVSGGVGVPQQVCGIPTIDTQDTKTFLTVQTRGQTGLHGASLERRTESFPHRAHEEVDRAQDLDAENPVLRQVLHQPLLHGEHLLFQRVGEHRKTTLSQVKREVRLLIDRVYFWALYSTLGRLKKNM